MTQRARYSALLGMALLAAQAGTACAPAEDPEKLFAALSSPDLEMHQEASDKIETIIRSGDYRFCLRGIDSRTPMVRAESIVALARMPQPEARQALRDLLAIDKRMMLPYNPIRVKPSGEEWDSRILVAGLIQRSGGDPKALPTLLAGAVDSQTSDVIAATCFAVGALRDPAGLPFLDEASKHPETAVARAAAEALAFMPAPEAVAILSRLATHPQQEVRADALSALVNRDDEATKALLMSVGKSDPSPDIRASAFDMLSRFKSQETVPYFIDRLKDAPAETRPGLTQILTRLTGQSLGAKPEAWSRWWAKNRGAVPAGA